MYRSAQSPTVLKRIVRLRVAQHGMPQLGQGGSDRR